MKTKITSFFFFIFSFLSLDVFGQQITPRFDGECLRLRYINSDWVKNECSHSDVISENFFSDSYLLCEISPDKMIENAERILGFLLSVIGKVEDRQKTPDLTLTQRSLCVARLVTASLSLMQRKIIAKETIPQDLLEKLRQLTEESGLFKDFQEQIDALQAQIDSLLRQPSQPQLGPDTRGGTEDAWALGDDADLCRSKGGDSRVVSHIVSSGGYQGSQQGRICFFYVGSKTIAFYNYDATKVTSDCKGGPRLYIAHFGSIVGTGGNGSLQNIRRMYPHCDISVEK